MARLGEVYERAGGGDIGLRRLYAGIGLFLLGAVLVVAGIVVATTGVARAPDTTLFQVREWGGVLAGVGTPLVFLGLLTVLPAGRTTRATAVVGTAVAFLGVALFFYAYPCRWSGANCAPGLPDLTLPTVGLYFLGAITTFWCLFVGIANFKTRNDPGGTVTMEITKQGETRVVEVDRDELRREGLGGIGFFGDRPDGEVETQTNRTPASDGGASSNDVRSPLDETAPPASPSTPGDAYCGNCGHFEYVRTDGGIRPYCGYHDELMDDMDPCEEWTGR